MNKIWHIAVASAIIVLLVSMLTGCSESSGSSSYGGRKTYSDYDRYYSDTEIQNFINSNRNK